MELEKILDEYCTYNNLYKGIKSEYYRELIRKEVKETIKFQSYLLNLRYVEFVDAFFEKFKNVLEVLNGKNK